ncbi:hypothetical protein [Streptomyces sp. 1222.5]|uniref:hypothetical protein n=1 Tax=Streptomyces sp. 1222.5 TaxID=1881026 RepID=UPI003D7446B0
MPDVGGFALRDARPPTGELYRRPRIPGCAQHALGDPALAPAMMHRLLDLAGVAAPLGS